MVVQGLLQLALHLIADPRLLWQEIHHDLHKFRGKGQHLLLLGQQPLHLWAEIQVLPQQGCMERLKVRLGSKYMYDNLLQYRCADALGSQLTYWEQA
jgi:hypothetical protein